MAFTPQKRLSTSEKLLGTVSTDEGEMSSPSMSSPSPKWQPRTMNYFHRPSSVGRLGQNSPVVEFNDWVQSIPSGWDQIHEIFHDEDKNPAGGTFQDNGNQGMRGLTKKRWVRVLMPKGYPNEDGLIDVFNEIAKEACATKKGHTVDLMDAPREEEITLPQLKRFARRMISVNCTLAAHDEQSPASRFVKLLVKQHTSTLRAWRTKLDVHGTGRIAYADFTVGCRNLGVPSQAKLIWNNLRADQVARLELIELDPREGSNLEDFAETLWNTMGFDLHKAWDFLDPHNKKVLTWEMFSKGVSKLGFDGDARLLFKGLDSSGLGRVKQDDFMYIGKVSRLAQNRLGASNQASQGVTDLISWVQRELGGAHELIVKLGLGSGMSEIVVGDLAARLTALGFEGDALQASTKAARGEGGTTVSAEALYSLLSGGRPRTPKSPGPASPRSPLLSTRRQLGKSSWCDGVDNLSEHNKTRCKYTRGYFHPPDRLDDSKSSSYSTQSLGLSPRALNIFREEIAPGDGRPGWCDNFGLGVQAQNEGVSAHVRKYFSDLKERPVRERQHAKVQHNLAERGQGYW